MKRRLRLTHRYLTFFVIVVMASQLLLTPASAAAQPDAAHRSVVAPITEKASLGLAPDSSGPYALARSASQTGGEDLVAAYNFDATSGTTLADISGNGHTGALTNGPAWSVSGKNGGALSFDGTNDLVTIADANDLDLTTGMTLEAWVYPTQSSGWRTVVFKSQGNDLVYALYANSDSDRPRGYIYRTGEDDVSGTAQLSTNTWAHLAVTYDGTTLRLYVNGAEVASSTYSGSIATSTGALGIGGNAVWGEYFAGRIDDLRIYSRALSAAEIATDRDTAVGSGATPTNTPTNTSAPATNTPTNTATSAPATNTPTNTSAPATNTPTNTSAPATNTPTNTATNTPTPASASLVLDTFSRTVSSGWGSADVGGSYSTPGSSASNYAVNGSVGQFTHPSASTTRELALTGAGSPSAQDVEVTARIAASAIPASGGELRFQLIARQVNSNTMYRGAVRFLPDGSVKLQAQSVVGGTETWLDSSVTASGLTVTANSFVRVRMQVSGTNPTTIRMRVWADGASEPSTWAYTSSSDSTSELQTTGGFGLRTQLTSGATNVPITASYDDWTVISLGAGSPTNTPTNTATNTATNTSAPATNTPTNTPVPPTNTPTNTPVLPTNTPTSTPTSIPAT